METYVALYRYHLTAQCNFIKKGVCFGGKCIGMALSTFLKTHTPIQYIRQFYRFTTIERMFSREDEQDIRLLIKKNYSPYFSVVSV